MDPGRLPYDELSFPTTARGSRGPILVGGLLLTGLSGFILLGRLRRTAHVEAWSPSARRSWPRRSRSTKPSRGSLAESRSALTAQVVQLNEKNQQIQLLNEVGGCPAVVPDRGRGVRHDVPPRSAAPPRNLGALFIHDAGEGPVRAGRADGESGRSPACLQGGGLLGPAPGQDSRGDPGEREPSLPPQRGRAGRRFPLHPAGSDREDDRPAARDRVRSSPLTRLPNRWPSTSALPFPTSCCAATFAQLSIHDPLTGLYNRRYMEETLETEIRRAERKAHAIGVIMLDIDHFKTFNDGFGHAAGDQMLRAIGALVLSHLRAGDIACRYGGEEILLILPEATVRRRRAAGGGDPGAGEEARGHAPGHAAGPGHRLPGCCRLPAQRTHARRAARLRRCVAVQGKAGRAGPGGRGRDGGGRRKPSG